MDVLSSIMVLWRFRDDSACAEAVRVSEQQASFGISLTVSPQIYADDGFVG